MKKNKKTIILTVISFLGLMSLVALMNSDVTFAADENIYYIADLKDGDFVPNGSTLIGSKSYTASGVRTTYAILYIEESQESYWHSSTTKTVTIQSTDTYTINDYQSYFTDSSSNYDGWEVDVIEYGGSDGYKIELFPKEKYNEIEISDDYEVTACCSDDSKITTHWYKSVPVTDIQLETPDRTLWTIENNQYSYHIDDFTSPIDLNSTLTIKYTAKAGDIFTFDYRTSERALMYTLGETTSRLYDNKFVVEDDGEYEFTISNILGDYNTYPTKYSYRSLFFELKNITVLTPLNEGQILDKSLVKDGDIIYHESICENGYQFREYIEYTAPKEPENTEPEDTPDKDNPENDAQIPEDDTQDKENTKEEDKITNPETNTQKIFIVVASIMFLASLLVILANKEKVKQK